MTGISVIVPTYNRRDMVARAIASVLNQSAADIELVVVDDGSSDGTVESLRVFGSDVRCLARHHEGRSAARNAGFRATSAEYVLFLDSDDTLYPGALGTLAAVLDAREDVDLVYGDACYSTADLSPIERVSEGRPPTAHSLLDTLVLHDVIGPPHAAMTRRRSLEQLTPAPFDEDLHGGEDIDLWVRLAAEGCRFECIDAVIGAYVLHGDNESSPWSPRRVARDRSLERWRRKVLEAPFFPQLAEETRREFLRQSLLMTLAGRIQEQDTVLSSAPFLGLDRRSRSALLRYVARANVMSDGSFAVARSRLARAARVNPVDMRAIALLFAACCGPRALRRVFEWRRHREGSRTSVNRSLAPHWRNPSR